MPKDTLSRPPARRGRKPKPRALELHITLAEIEPPIWRRVRVPDVYTLDQLHRVIQLVFGWLDYHRYRFEVGGQRFEKRRNVAEGEDPAGTTSSDLALKEGAQFTYVYGLRDRWVHEIVVEDVYISTPREEDGPPLPMLYDGERAGPIEDRGGPDEHQQLVDALRDPHNPEHRENRVWAAGYDPERFDVRMARNNLTVAAAAAWGAI